MLRIVCVVFMAAVAAGARGEGPPGGVKDFMIPANASPPFTYCAWYLRDPDSSVFLNDLRASPPDLFHLGYHIPFKGALGPTYGHDLFTDDILPPEQIPREIERIRGVIGGMRAAGVDRIIPYVYTMAFFGNPDKRTGFFHFFDHWDDYRAYGLGPKPDADPSLWCQQRAPQPLGGGPGDVLHFEPCINHPVWSQYLDLVVKQLALVGYDGMFFDVNTQYCYCPHCQERFDVYLLDKYGRQGLRTIFGTDDHRALNLSTIYRDFEETILKEFGDRLVETWARRNLSRVLGVKGPGEVKLEEDWRLLRCYMQGSLGEFADERNLRKQLLRRFGATTAEGVPAEKRADFTQAVLRHEFRDFIESRKLADLLRAKFGSSDIRRRCCGTPRDMLLWVETQRFWCRSMAALFGRLKAVGRAGMAEQGRSGDFFTVANLGSMATVDGLNKRRVDGIDLAHWAPVADMQMFEEMQQCGSLESGVIVSNILAFRWAMAAGTRAGTLLYKVTEDRAADLAQAEAAAGGGGALIQGALAAPESRKRWRRFFSEHADLWDRGISSARVGLLFWSDQVFYEYPEHYGMVRALVNVLSETQVPFDIVTEEGASTVSRYDLVIAPMLRYLDTAQIGSLLDYVKNGGNLVVIEPFGTEDKCAMPRKTDVLAETGAADDFRAVSLGKGRLLRLTPKSVPKRQSELWRLMEERACALVQTRDLLNEARRKELKDGEDLGPDFIRRIEESFALTLRWCQPGTDPGVYIHPYRLPSGSDRPDRLVVHVVNYHVPILLEKGGGERDDPMWSTVTRSGEPVATHNLRITAPLPARTEVGRVEAFSPTDPKAPVKWSVDRGRLNLEIDQLVIYQAVEIAFSK